MPRRPLHRRSHGGPRARAGAPVPAARRGRLAHALRAALRQGGAAGARGRHRRRRGRRPVPGDLPDRLPAPAQLPGRVAAVDLDSPAVGARGHPPRQAPAGQARAARHVEAGAGSQLAPRLGGERGRAPPVHDAAAGPPAARAPDGPGAVRDRGPARCRRSPSCVAARSTRSGPASTGPAPSWKRWPGRVQREPVAALAATMRPMREGRALRQALDEARPGPEGGRFARQRVWGRVQSPWWDGSGKLFAARRRRGLGRWLAPLLAGAGVASVAAVGAGDVSGGLRAAAPTRTRARRRAGPVGVGVGDRDPAAAAASPLTTGPGERVRHRLARGVDVELRPRTAVLPGDAQTPPEVRVGRVRFSVPHQPPGLALHRARGRLPGGGAGHRVRRGGARPGCRWRSRAAWSRCRTSRPGGRWRGCRPARAGRASQGRVASRVRGGRPAGARRRIRSARKVPGRALARAG